MTDTGNSFLIINPRREKGVALLEFLVEKGARVDITTSVPEAGVLLDRNSYDCVLIDTEIPESSKIYAGDPPVIAPNIFLTGIGIEHISNSISSIPSDGYVEIERESVHSLVNYIERTRRHRMSTPGVRIQRSPVIDDLSRSESCEAIVDNGLTILTHRYDAKLPCKEIAVVSKTSPDSYGIFLCDITTQNEKIDFELLSLETKVRTFLDENVTASGFLAAFNTYLTRTYYGVDFVTATVMMIDTANKEVRAAGAGYRPMAYRPWGRSRWRLLETQGIPLGIRHNFIFRERVLKLAPGDKLLSLSEDYMRLGESISDISLMDDILVQLDKQPLDAAPDEVIESLESYVSSSEGRVRGNSTAILMQF